MFTPIIVASWSVFGIYWLYAAGSAKKISLPQRSSERLLYWSLTGLSSMLLLAPELSPLPNRLNEVPSAAALRPTTSMMCLAGLAIAIWSRRTLGRNWSATVAIKKDHELVRVGPYRYVRHPIYTGLFLMFAGTALQAWRLGAVAGLLLFLAAHWNKLRREESLMLRQFPNSYPAYMARTKAVVPLLL